MPYDEDMARADRVRDVCDVCESKRRQVKRYRVGQAGRLVTVVLCREHAKYVEELIMLGTHVPTQSATVKVWDIAEIEKLKRAQNKRTPPQSP